MLKLEPFIMQSPQKDYIWGGTKLIKNWNKESETGRIAESWEMSLYKNNESIADSGRYKGLSLPEIYDIFPGMFGENINKFDRFPILIKLIDAADNLSIQVHPMDEYALKVEKELGKTEMWYVADADVGSGIYYGFKKDMTKESFKKAIENHTICDYLNYIPVKKGDTFFIEAGTLHAILKGVTIIEIQENSNITYRVFDYNRIDKNGLARELHIDKALEVTNLKKDDMPTQTASFVTDDGKKERTLAKCKYFEVKEIETEDILVIDNRLSFVALTIAEGNAYFGSTLAVKGNTIFIPAGCRTVLTGKFVAIATSI